MRHVFNITFAIILDIAIIAPINDAISIWTAFLIGIVTVLACNTLYQWIFE